MELAQNKRNPSFANAIFLGEPFVELSELRPLLGSCPITRAEEKSALSRLLWIKGHCGCQPIEQLLCFLDAPMKIAVHDNLQATMSQVGLWSQSVSARRPRAFFRSPLIEPLQQQGLEFERAPKLHLQDSRLRPARFVLRTQLQQSLALLGPRPTLPPAGECRRALVAHVEEFVPGKTVASKHRRRSQVRLPCARAQPPRSQRAPGQRQWHDFSYLACVRDFLARRVDRAEGPRLVGALPFLRTNPRYYSSRESTQRLDFRGTKFHSQLSQSK
jgi:hypothetical protein